MLDSTGIYDMSTSINCADIMIHVQLLDPDPALLLHALQHRPHQSISIGSFARSIYTCAHLLQQLSIIELSIAATFDALVELERGRVKGPGHEWSTDHEPGQTSRSPGPGPGCMQLRAQFLARLACNASCPGYMLHLVNAIHINC